MKKSIITIVLIFLLGCQQKITQPQVEYKNNKTDHEIPNNDSSENIDTPGISQNIKDHFKQGIYFLSRRDYDNAIRKLELAVKLKPDFAQAHYNLGVAYFETKRINLSIQEWENVINLDPNYAKAYLSLAFSFEKLSNNDKAVEYYTKYIELKPDDPNADKINKKINSLRKQVVGQGIIGRVTITDKIDIETYQPLLSKDIFNDNVPVIYTTAEVGDAPENTKIKIVWYYQGIKGQEILVNSKEHVITGPNNMLFEITKPETKPWPIGRYEVRIYVDGKENLSVPFTILKGDKTGAKRTNT